MMLLGFGVDTSGEGLTIDSEVCDANPNTYWDAASQTCVSIGASQTTQDSCNINPATYWDPISNSCKIVPPGSSQVEAAQISVSNASDPATKCNSSSVTYWDPTSRSCQSIGVNPTLAQKVKTIAASSVKPWYMTPAGMLGIALVLGIGGYTLYEKRKAAPTALQGRRR